MKARPTPPPPRQRHDPPPRLFALHRAEDVTGISGTGLVCYGVRWPNGRVTMWWRGDRSGVSQISHFDAMHDLMRVHGHGGRTALVWLTAEQPGNVDLLDTAPMRAGFHEWKKANVDWADRCDLRHFEIAASMMVGLGVLLDGYDQLAAAYRRQGEQLEQMRAEHTAMQDALDVIADVTPNQGRLDEQ